MYELSTAFTLAFYNLNEGIFKDCIDVLVKDGKV